jgi:DNA repair exonuclease SbcCD ATPase subunit
VLASLRGRGEFRRPFDRVEALRRDAEAKYLSKEQELEQSIQQSQARIGELQREKKGTGVNALILSPEQEAELKKLEETMASARKELREVQYRLRREIDGLGSGLMLANVALWPAFVAVGASVWTARRMLGQRRGGGGR